MDFAGFSNFDNLAFGATSNHKETLAITNTAVLPDRISGFTQRGDIVDLTQLAPKNASATLNASDRLVVSNRPQSVSLQLDSSENYGGVVWLARPDGSGGTDVAVIGAHGGASLSRLADGSRPLVEHFIFAHGHSPPYA